MELIKFDNEKKYINDFIKLYKKIYSKNENMQDEKEIKQILNNNHILNKYFKLDKFLIYQNKKVVARFVITTYEGDNNVYIGLFECVNDNNVAKFVFEKVYEFVKQKGYNSIVGPVDMSFWFKYRLKINLFNKKPYTCEPYNKEYYLQMFLDNGYKVCEHYISNIFPVIEDNNAIKKFEERFEIFTKNGYKIISPKVDEFDNLLEDIYYLITNLYSDFPIYKNIELNDFKSIFINYKKIINMDMVKIAYYEDKVVGFFISVPNYNNKVYHLNNIFNILEILKIKKKPSEYVMLYMGVDSNHTGLGKALAGAIQSELIKNKLPSIGALQRDGKITQEYGKEIVEENFEYVLLRCDIND